MSLVLGRTRSDLDTMHRLDTRRFDSSDFPPFYQSYPPPMIAPSGIYGGRMEYTETPLWKDRKEERKLYTKYQSEYSPKLFQPYGNLDFNERDRTINDKVELRAFHDSTEKRFPNPGLMLELDLTTSQRHSMEMHSPISPSEYFYRRRDILSNGSSSHSTSPVSPFSGEVTASKPKYASSVKNNNGSHSPASHGMMDKNEEGVINLSTTKDVALDNRMNGDISHNGGHKEAFQERLLSSPTESGSSKMTNGSPDSLSNGVAAKRKSKCNSTVDLGTASQPLMMMAAQQGMLQQHVQQMMQGQGLSSPAVQQLLQHQTMLQHQQQQKLQEQVLHELNEQLQMNVIQQTQLMQQQQTDKAKGSNKQQLQHLSLQQQQLVQQIQQIQLQQRQYLLACLVNPYSVSQGMMLPPELQQLWKEVASQTGADTENGKGSFKGLGSLASTPTTQSNPAWTANGLSSSYLPHGMIGQPPVSVNLDDVERKNSILYRHGVCKWPGCDIACDDLASFQKHLDVEHQLDDRSTAQARVQMQVVSQLEIQLTREKDLLQGMMLHLHMKKPMEPKVEVSHAQKLASHKISSPVSPVSMATLHSAPTSPPRHGTTLSSPLKMQLNMTSISSVSAPPTPVSLVSNPLSLPLGIAPSLSTSMSKPPTPMSQSSASQPSTPTCGGGPMRRRVSDKCNLPISSGTSEEIQRNRDFYKSTDVRPPFTYASLIRQAIIESPHKQLTLNEIYQWFQTTFAYFRRNEATWKNAVRHNLSLHKCFMRVENVKGAVWTVDEVEFYKRRPQKLGGFEDDYGSYWMVDDIEFVRRRHLSRGRPRKYHDCDQHLSMSMKDVKSPIIPTDPSMFGENLNASLRAALEQANLLNHHYSNGSVSMDGVEDLSMKSSRNSSSDSFNKGDSPSQDEFPDIKEEEEDHHDNNEEAFLGQSQMELRAIPESDNQTDDMAESTPSLTESTHSASASLDRQVGLQHSVGIYTDIQCTLREEEPPESDCSEQYSNVDMYLPSQGETMNSEESDPLGS